MAVPPLAQLTPASGAGATLLVTDVDDLVALQAAGGLHLDHLARLLADQRSRDRRADVDAAVLDVGLVLADDLPGEGAAFAILDVHGGAEDAAAAGVDQLRVDHLRVAELGFELGDAPRDEAGALARRVVLGIFRQVAVRARLADRRRVGRALDGLQPVQLFAQQVGAALGHGNLHGLDVTGKGSEVGSRSFACNSCRTYGSSRARCFMPAHAALPPATVV